MTSDRPLGNFRSKASAAHFGPVVPLRNAASMSCTCPRVLAECHRLQLWMCQSKCV